MENGTFRTVIRLQIGCETLQCVIHTEISGRPVIPDDFVAEQHRCVFALDLAGIVFQRSVQICTFGYSSDHFRKPSVSSITCRSSSQSSAEYPSSRDSRAMARRTLKFVCTERVT